jgi:hypothetical protein
MAISQMSCRKHQRNEASTGFSPSTPQQKRTTPISMRSKAYLHTTSTGLNAAVTPIENTYKDTWSSSVDFEWADLQKHYEERISLYDAELQRKLSTTQKKTDGSPNSDVVTFGETEEEALMWEDEMRMMTGVPTSMLDWSSGCEGEPESAKSWWSFLDYGFDTPSQS